ncbi:multidrug effflux MFS transporter [Alkalihalobacillus deserti]|uniref:multidrug effflux MFS transporter n=1 Tax=Alkalihalobacillus deserti TaxID=2879466 RepID=UPI001D15AD63|nr:multidrug effflux MFS transporter [Alkalihalobacillus deserti]
MEVKKRLDKRIDRLIIILILGGLAAIGPLNTDMYLPAFPMIKGDLDTTASLVQLSLTAGLLGLAFGQVIAGPLSDIHGRRKLLLISLSLFTVISILCALAPSIELFIFLRIIQGLTGGAGIVISRACVRDLYSGSEMTKIFSILVLIMGIAPILAPVVGGTLLQFVTWRGIFITLSGLGAMMLLAIAFRFPETLPKEKRIISGFQQTAISLRKLAGDHLFLGYALAMGLSYGAMFAYISGSPFVLQEIYQVSPQLFSVMFGINAIGLVVASQVTGRLAGRIGENRFITIGLVTLFTGGILLLSFTLMETGLLSILFAFFLVVSSAGFIGPSCTSLAMSGQSSNAGSASAFLGVISFGIGGMVSPLVGMFGTQTALPLGIVVAVCSVSAVVVYLVIIRKSTLSIKHQTGVGQ